MNERLRWLAWRAAWLLGIAALAIGLTRGGEREDPDAVNLVYWGYGADPRVHEYEARRPGVRVRYFPLAGDAADNPTKLIISIAGGTAPDVILVDRMNVAAYASRGAFVALEDYLADSEVLSEQDFYPAAIGETQWNGHTWAIPWGYNVRALFYNKDMLIREGLVDEDGEAKPPRTWEELREYSKRLTIVGKDGRMERAGFIPHHTRIGNSWFYLYSWQAGGAFLSEDGRTSTFDTPENARALSYMLDLYGDLGGIEEVTRFVFAFRSEADHPFIRGQVAMYTSGDWELNTLAKYAPQMNFGVAPAPMPSADDEPLTWAAGWSLAIPKGSKNPEEAWKLIEFLRSPEGMRSYHRYNQSASRARGAIYTPNADSNRRVNEEIVNPLVYDNPNLPRNVKGAAETFEWLRPRARHRPTSPIGNSLWTEQERVFERAAHGEDVQGVLAASQKRMQAELDRRLGEPGRTVRWGVVGPLLALLGLALLIAAVVWHTRRTKMTVRRGPAVAGYLFAAPFLIGLIVFTGGPILASLVLSTTQFDGLQPAQFIGLDNYRELFAGDALFWTSLWNTVFMLVGLPIGMAVGLGISLLLEKESRGMRVYRTIFYLPAVVPIVAAALLWIWMLHPSDGLINATLIAVGIDNPPNWLSGSGTVLGQAFYWSKSALILMGLWGAGAGMVIWLAGLKDIPRSLYKAAAIDGAGPWQRFRHVTLPMLSPYIFFNLIMGVIYTFQIFTQAYVMTDGGPADSTRFYAYYLFDNAFRYFKMGQASAMAWILFAIVFVLTFVQLRLGARWVHYQGE